MKSAETLARAHVRQCDPPDRCEGWPKTDYCVCERRTEWLADIIRAAQIDAAEWMREEAVKAASLLMAAADTDLARDEELYDAIRAIRVPK